MGPKCLEIEYRKMNGQSSRQEILKMFQNELQNRPFWADRGHFGPPGTLW